MKFPKVLFAFFTGAAFASLAPDSAVTEFEKKIAVQFQAKYNYAAFTNESTEDEQLETNRPIDLGLGGGYGDWTWSTLFTFRFGEDGKKPKTSAMDFSLNHYGRRFFGKLDFKMNRGFCWKDSSGEYHKLDLRTFLSGYELEYLWNPEHSVRAAYALDRRQWKSNGSFVAGFGAYYFGIASHEERFSKYRKFQHIVHAGPNAGYSRTWIWRNGIFLNVMGIGTVSLGRNLSQSSWAGFVQVFPKFVAGYHGESWSIHFPFELNIAQFQIDGIDRRNGDVLLSGSGGFMVTRRF